MAIKNSKTVALERRYDLASLFCMIARHGPAVAIATIVLLSVLAAFIIYRNVKGKRRKATAENNRFGAEKIDAAVTEHESEPEEELKEKNGLGLTRPLKENDDSIQSPPATGGGCIAAAEVCHVASNESLHSSKPKNSDSQDLLSKRDCRVGDPCRPLHDDQEAGGVAGPKTECNVNPFSAPEIHAKGVDQSLGWDLRTGADADHFSLRGDNNVHGATVKRLEEMNQNQTETDEEAWVYLTDEDMTSDTLLPCKNTALETDVPPALTLYHLTRPFIYNDEACLSEKTEKAATQDKDLQSEMEDVTDCSAETKDGQVEELIEDSKDSEKHRGDHLLAAQGKKHDEKERAGYKMISQQAEKQEQEANLPSSHLPSAYRHQEQMIGKPTTSTKDGVENDSSTASMDHLGDLPEMCDPDRQSLSQQQLQSEDEHSSHHSLPLSLSDQPKDETEVTTIDAPCTSAQDINNSVDLVTKPEIPITAIVDGSPLSSIQSSQREVDNEMPPWYQGDLLVLGHHLTSPTQEYHSGKSCNRNFYPEHGDVFENTSDLSHVSSSGEDRGSAPVLAEVPAFMREQLSENDVDSNVIVLEQTTADGGLAEPETDALYGNYGTSSVGVENGKEDVLGPQLPLLYQEDQFKPFDEDCTAGQTDKVTTAFTDEAKPLIDGSHLPSVDQSEKEGNVDNHLSSAGVNEDSGMSINITDYIMNSLEDAYYKEDVLAPIPEIENRNLISQEPFAQFQPLEVSPYPLHLNQQASSEQKYQAICETWGDSVSAKEIEDRYHREIDRFSEWIAASIDSHTGQLDMEKEVLELSGMKEKEKGKGDRKEGTRADEEKEEGKEKTEISIMDATMDHNEWIADENQVYPWMTLDEQRHDLTTATDVKDTAIDTYTMDGPANNHEETGVPLPAGETGQKNNKSQMVKVTFCVHYRTSSTGQRLAVTGNRQELGCWKAFVPMERIRDGFWVNGVSLPAESQVEWKFVLLDEDRVHRWEECDNRCLDTGYGDDLYVHKWWGIQ